jgi:hypothetical protein
MQDRGAWRVSDGSFSMILIRWEHGTADGDQTAWCNFSRGLSKMHTVRAENSLDWHMNLYLVMRNMQASTVEAYKFKQMMKEGFRLVYFPCQVSGHSKCLYWKIGNSERGKVLERSIYGVHIHNEIMPTLELA